MTSEIWVCFNSIGNGVLIICRFSDVDSSGESSISSVLITTLTPSASNCLTQIFVCIKHKPDNLNVASFTCTLTPGSSSDSPLICKSWNVPSTCAIFNSGKYLLRT